MSVTCRGRACRALTFRRVKVQSLQPKGAADGAQASQKSLLSASDSQGRGCAYSCHKFPYRDDWGTWRLVRGLRLLHEYGNTDTVVVSSRAKRQGFSQVARLRWVIQLGSTVSTGDIRLDRRHIVGLLLLALSQPRRVSPLEGFRPS
jgi:hypothetical protein